MCQVWTILPQERALCFRNSRVARLHSKNPSGVCFLGSNPIYILSFQQSSRSMRLPMDCVTKLFKQGKEENISPILFTIQSAESENDFELFAIHQTWMKLYSTTYLPTFISFLIRSSHHKHSLYTLKLPRESPREITHRFYEPLNWTMHNPCKHVQALLQKEIKPVHYPRQHILFHVLILQNLFCFSQVQAHSSSRGSL